MALIETGRSDVRALAGVHLFHFATSNCSQRVRLVLEEKDVPWESHHVNLIKHENATPDFLALNPRGVVPVLVHDGQTIVESNDIVRYVEEQFEGPALNPADPVDRQFVERSLDQSSDFQDALKLLTYEFLFKPVRRMDQQELAAYAHGIRNPRLIEFMREFSSESGFSEDRVRSAVREAESAFHTLETRLKDRPWLSGEDCGLADISWVVNVHRCRLMDYPVERFLRLAEWLFRMQARPSFERAISRFESPEALAAFRDYTAMRHAAGTSVRDFA